MTIPTEISNRSTCVTCFEKEKLANFPVFGKNIAALKCYLCMVLIILAHRSE